MCSTFPALKLCLTLKSYLYEHNESSPSCGAKGGTALQNYDIFGNKFKFCQNYCIFGPYDKC